MKKLIEEHFNTPEHYNKIFMNRQIDYSEQMRTGVLLKRFNGGRFLEIGCGVAPHCIIASEKSKEVWGMDFCDKVIPGLRRKYPQINYVVGDMYDMPFRDNFFDYVVLGEVLEHHENPEKLLEEAYRILRTGGVVAVSVPMEDSGSCAPEEHIWSFQENDIKDLMGKKFHNCETFILTEDRHNFIMSYGTKL